MWSVTLDGVRPLEFYRRRIIRIVPLYWSLTTFVVIVLAFVPQIMPNDRLEPVHVLYSYLFLPADHPTRGMIAPVLVPGWTLNYEMFFYLIFGFALILPPIWRLLTVSSVLIALSAAPMVIDLPATAFVTHYTSNSMLEFVYGMALGWLYVANVRLPRAWAWALLLTGLIALVLSGPGAHLHGLVVGGPALMIVAGAVMIERASGVPRLPALHALGNGSYSIYLSHYNVLPVVSMIGLKAVAPSLPNQFVLFAAVQIIIVVLVGMGFHACIEKPILRLGRVGAPGGLPGRQVQGAPAHTQASTQRFPEAGPTARRA